MGCPDCLRIGTEGDWHRPQVDDVHSRYPQAAVDLDEEEAEAIFTLDSWEVYEDAWALLIRKHNAYGPGNIALAPGTDDVPGWKNGLMVRMWDKMSRLRHLVYNGGEDQVGEAETDTIQDLLNYCAIWTLCARNQWPSPKEIK